MGDSTRLSRKSHQARVAAAAGLVVFSMTGPLVASTSEPGFAPDAAADTPSQPQSPQPAAALTSITVTAAGAEKLQLSGRFRAESDRYAESINWTVKTADGTEVFSGPAQLLSLPLPPGSYEVIGRYGTVSIDDAVTLPPGTAVSVNWILNAGALCVAPHLTAGAAASEEETRIYATNGSDTGRLVAVSHTPGEMIKLAAGNYRVETGLEPGNVRAETTVEIDAGFMRALDITLHGGIVQLPRLDPQSAWTVSSDSGEKFSVAGDAAAIALKPGAYIAETAVNGSLQSRSFTVLDGASQSLTITP